MLTKTIEGTSLEVSSICLGTALMGTQISTGEAFSMLDEFMDMGGVFFDTANCYANWIPGAPHSASESTIGSWAKTRRCRDKIVIGTKGGHPQFGSMSTPRLSPTELASDLKDSLYNLQVDVIDLYWLHRDDPTRPVEEIIGVLNGFVREGYIRYFGCSNWCTQRLAQAQDHTRASGLMSFSASQVLWNLAKVDAPSIGDPTIQVMDREMWDYHNKTGLAAIPFSSQANGYFSKYASGNIDTLSELHKRMYSSEENTLRSQRVVRLAGDLGVSPNAVALAYVTSQPFTAIPIVGPRTLHQLKDTLSSTDIKLDTSQLTYLDGANPGSRT